MVECYTNPFGKQLWQKFKVAKIFLPCVEKDNNIFNTFSEQSRDWVFLMYWLFAVIGTSFYLFSVHILLDLMFIVMESVSSHLKSNS